MALLELRGQDQFTRDRGGQLYVLIRSQIVSSAMTFPCSLRSDRLNRIVAFSLCAAEYSRPSGPGESDLHFPNQHRQTTVATPQSRQPRLYL
jgi:hypothetical protein